MTEQEQVTKLLADAEEAVDFLKAFVVQAKLNERGNFGEQDHAIQSMPVLSLCDASRRAEVKRKRLRIYAAMHVEPHHADASAEEAALRPERS